MTGAHILPSEFLRRLEVQLPDEKGEFLEAITSPAETSILLNTAKSTSPPRPIAEKVPWNPNGYYLKERPAFVFDPRFHAGGYYVMEASSMLLAEALDSCDLAAESPLVLDLCAAPGGKSMVTLNHLNGKGILVANEVNRKRFPVLNENIAKWGHANVITCNMDPSRLDLDSTCDCVIVDAPCSGEGLFRKTPRSIQEWSAANARHCSLRQRRILHEAIRLVKPGGFLIYSTCTFNPDENIRNVAWLGKEFEALSIPLRNEHQAEPVDHSGYAGYQCWPHRMRGEGFFISILQKDHDERHDKRRRNRSPLRELRKREASIWHDFLREGSYRLYTTLNERVKALPAAQADEMRTISSRIPGSRPGLDAGVIKGPNVVPSHDLALSLVVSDRIHRVGMDLDEAINYLRRNVLENRQLPSGWHLAHYNGLDMGWIKQAGKQTKNYYPIEWRIRKQSL